MLKLHVNWVNFYIPLCALTQYGTGKQSVITLLEKYIEEAAVVMMRKYFFYNP